MKIPDPFSSFRSNEPTTIWISSAVFKWDFLNEGVIERPKSAIGEPYRHLDHVFEILDNDPTDLHLTDAVLTLNRLIDIRIGQLDCEYHLKQLPVFGTKLSPIEKLEKAGVIRKRLLLEVKRIRNLIEHQRKSPPSTTAVADLAEFAWYFLRSTDYLLIEFTHGLSFCPGDFAYYLSIGFNYEKWWEPEVAAWTTQNEFSRNPKRGWIQVKASVVCSREQLRQFTPDAHQIEEAEGIFEGRGRHPTDMHVAGTPLLSNEYLQSLIRLYFSPDRETEFLTHRSPSIE